MRFQASFLPEASDTIYMQVFGPVQRFERDGRTVLVTRAFRSLEHLRTLCGTFQSRMERANRSFSGAVIQPAGTIPPTRTASYQNFEPLKVRLDYGLYTAAEPLEHPDTVIIPPNQYYPQGLTEQQIVNYYELMEDRLLSQYRDYHLQGMIKMVVDSQEIMKRHLGPENQTELETPETFEDVNRGRTVEFHFAIGPETNMAWVDLDPGESFPFEDLKDIAIELAAEMGRALGDQVSVRFSGRSGFHVVALLPEPRNTDEVRKEVQDLVRRYMERKGDERLTDQVTKDPTQMRLDYSTLHDTGGLRMPWSLANPTGLICLPLDPDRVKMFRKEDAAIDQVLQTQSSETMDPVILAAIQSGKDIGKILAEWEMNQKVPTDPNDIDIILKLVKEAGGDGFQRIAIMLKMLAGTNSEDDPERATRGYAWPGSWYEITADQVQDMVLALNDAITKSIYKPRAQQFDQAMAEMTASIEIQALIKNLVEAAGLIQLWVDHHDIPHDPNDLDLLSKLLEEHPENLLKLVGQVQFMRRDADITEQHVLNWLKEMHDEAYARIRRGEYQDLPSPPRSHYTPALTQLTELRNPGGLTAAIQRFGAALEEYRQKRQFDQTSEPSGTIAEKTEPIFVVQQHDAKKAGLHYDFRLAHEGVLKSWAVPKLSELTTGGSPQVLAVEVEDHPLDYATFEGSAIESCERTLLLMASIPAGYGAGEVKIWDEGKYETVTQDEGHWKFRLHGARLQGTFTLIRTAGNRWLMRRAKNA